MATVPQYPIRIFYDGACSICTRKIDFYLRRDHEEKMIAIDISAAAFDPKLYGVSLQDFQYELHVIDCEGTIFRGVEALRVIWKAFPRVFKYRLLAVLVAIPGVKGMARMVYKLVAYMRPHFPKRGAICKAGQCRIGQK